MSLQRMLIWLLSLATGGVLGLGGVVAQAAETSGKIPAKIDFNKDVRPIISANCYQCHGPDETARKAKLRLDVRAEAIKERKGAFAIKPGDAKSSELVVRILSKDPDDVMPPPKSSHSLTDYQIAVLKKWVQQGAAYADHWAFIKPEAGPLPKIKAAGWPRNGIDRFILAKLEATGLKPAPVADRPTLIRRLSLDLTGLPPAPAEVDAFVADHSSNAYEKLVDRLLASPAYGERWARVWLDLARYADSAGYGSDPLRLNIWPYRDWVINALNQNLPYDQFSLKQLAGDLLPHPSQDDLVATAFHRNTMTNTEGGTDDEEFRVAAVKDRIATTAEVWMGLTMGCAQCHSHKYDPISQKEYYQFFALFNQTEDNDQPDERPTLPLPTAAEQEHISKLEKQIEELNKQLKLTETSHGMDAAQSAWEREQAKGIAWTPLDAETVRATSGATLVRQTDGSWLATGAVPGRDTYTVQAHTSLKGITAIRLELLPDDSLPKHGPGRGENGIVELNDLKLAIHEAGQTQKAVRYIRIELPGTARLLSLAEVQVLSEGRNVALQGKARQSSTDYDGEAARAIDGNTDGHYFNAKSTTHTKSEDNPWWEVDLGRELPIDDVVVWNRTDGGTGTRLNNFKVLALDADRKTVREMTVTQPPSPSAQLDFSGDTVVKLTSPTSDLGKVEELEKVLNGAARSAWTGAGKAQTIVFETVGTVGGGDTLLKLVLGQSQMATNQVIGRFRWSATTAARPVRQLPANIQTIFTLAPAQRSPEQFDELTKYYRSIAPALQKPRQQLAKLEKEREAIKPVAVPVMRELADDKHRISHVLMKGNFLTPGETVEPDFPKAFGPVPKNAPLNRLGVADWVFSPDNPLTARVAVNRFWAQLFGTGLVETEEDFGSQGALPSNQELLDWLAATFQTPADKTVPGTDPVQGLGWDMKALVKLIVMSAAYQQTSIASPASLQKDAKDRLLSHYPRRRLDAETVRDQALALSGLLSHKIGGPSVYPPQPDGLWRAAFNGQRTYPTSTGDDRYRRGLYTVWRRTVPYPSMATFDAPSRENCTLRRLPTNTPLQAFVTLNDPAYVEMAQALGRRIVKEGGVTTDERIRYALKLALARSPVANQTQALRELYEAEVIKYRADAEAAKKLSTEPLGPLPAGMDAAEQAAWTVVANVLLNLDGVLTKG